MKFSLKVLMKAGSFMRLSTLTCIAAGAQLRGGVLGVWRGLDPCPFQQKNENALFSVLSIQKGHFPNME